MNLIVAECHAKHDQPLISYEFRNTTSGCHLNGILFCFYINLDICWFRDYAKAPHCVPATCGVHDNYVIMKKRIPFDGSIFGCLNGLYNLIEYIGYTYDIHIHYGVIMHSNWTYVRFCIKVEFVFPIGMNIKTVHKRKNTSIWTWCFFKYSCSGPSSFAGSYLALSDVNCTLFPFFIDCRARF